MSLLTDIKDIFGKKNISIRRILKMAGHRSFGVLLVILALPSALPVPAPGYSTPFGIALILIAIQIILGKSTPWMPRKIADKKMSGLKKKTIKKMQAFLKFFERFIRPRLPFVYGKVGYKIMGAFVLFAGISMMIPLPLTNTVPALGVFLIGLGMVEDDGLIGMGGILVSVIGVSITFAVLYFGAEAVQMLKDSIFG